MPGIGTEPHPPAWLGVIVAAGCVAALAPWPYGYYQLLRLVVTGYAAWVAWALASAERRGWPWLFGLLAVTYNPVFKIHMDRNAHAIVNVATAAIIAAALWRHRSRPTASDSSAPRG